MKRRIRIVAAAVVILTIVGAATFNIPQGFVSTAHAQANGPATMPYVSPVSSPQPNHCGLQGCRTTSGHGRPIPNATFPNNTGEETIAKPAIEYCNGRLYGFLVRCCMLQTWHTAFTFATT